MVSFLFAFLFPQCLEMVSQFGSASAAKYAGMLSGHFYDLHLDVFLGYPFYYIAGYYIHNHEHILELEAASGKSGRFRIRQAFLRHIIYALGICGVISGVILNTFTAWRAGAPSDLFHSCFTLHELFEALALFVFFKHNTHGGPRLGRFVLQLSSAGFGAYLIHDLVIMGLDRFAGLNAVTFHPLAAVPVTGIVTFVLSFAISWLLGRIPIVNRYLV